MQPPRPASPPPAPASWIAAAGQGITALAPALQGIALVSPIAEAASGSRAPRSPHQGGPVSQRLPETARALHDRILGLQVGWDGLHAPRGRHRALERPDPAGLPYRPPPARPAGSGSGIGRFAALQLAARAQGSATPPVEICRRPAVWLRPLRHSAGCGGNSVCSWEQRARGQRHVQQRRRLAAARRREPAARPSPPPAALAAAAAACRQQHAGPSWALPRRGRRAACPGACGDGPRRRSGGGHGAGCRRRATPRTATCRPRCR